MQYGTTLALDHAHSYSQVMGLTTNLRRLMAADDDISQNELARRSGVPQPTIARILSGQHDEPKESTLRKLADYFGVSTGDMRAENFDEAKWRASIARRVQRLEVAEGGLPPDIKELFEVVLRQGEERLAEATRRGKKLRD